VRHGETVAGEGVGGVLFEYLGEKSNAVHMSMVRRGAWGWQAAAIYTGKDERKGFSKNGVRIAVRTQ
jgi:hypothetical protein